MSSAQLDFYKEWLGIPEGPRPPDHYQLLRLVQFEDAADKIRANYKKLNAHVRKYATGKYSVESQDLLNELAKAMLCLTDVERKREYDEGLGREFPEESSGGRKPMEKILLQQKHISAAQAEEARNYADRSGLEMRDALVQLKFVDQELATQALATELGIPYLDLADMTPDDAVLDRVPKNLVKRNSILPLFIDDDKLLIACVHELTTELEDELRLRFQVPVRAVLSTPNAINQGIARYYAPGLRKEPVEEARTSKKSSGGSTARAEPAKRMRDLSPQEQQQRKQFGWLFMCWSVIGAVVIDQVFLPARWLIPNLGLTVLFIPPLVILFVLTVYWKK